MKAWLRYALITLAALLLLYVVAVNAPYHWSGLRSAIIDSAVADARGGAPEGTYPVLLLHGFNPTYSGRVSEYMLLPLQEALGDGCYVDKGVYTPRMTCAELRYTDEPIVLRMTYLDQYSLDTIDKYRDNLGDVVERVLTCTGAEKVDIVAHSMGGVVARAFIKEAVEAGRDPGVRRLVMLGTPNHAACTGLPASPACSSGMARRLRASTSSTCQKRAPCCAG